MLIECCFVDDKDDAKLYNYKRMAEAIVRGITGQAATAQRPNTKPETGIASKNLFQSTMDITASRASIFTYQTRLRRPVTTKMVSDT